MQWTREKILHALGGSIALLSALVLLATLLLYPLSFQGARETLQLTGPAETEFKLVSYHGRLMFGVFEPREMSRYYWRRSWRASIEDLILDENSYIVADTHGWGIALPHPALMLMATIPIAWWFMIFRDRREHHRRVTHGLCMNCGYDLRSSKEICPECGQPFHAANAA